LWIKTSGLCGDFIHRHQQHTGGCRAERVTRFLCGISVPLFTKLKARAIPGFAVLEDYPYAEVREWAQPTE
jgi:ATP-dependent DNA helicase RecQ